MWRFLLGFFRLSSPFQLPVAASFGYLFSRELTPLSALFAVVDFHVCGAAHSLLSTGLPTLDSEYGRFLTQCTFGLSTSTTCAV
jgi:hypothetical protein